MDITWHTPGRSSADSMPLGNGDVGLNVWTEPDGDLLFYISKTDAWSENVRLLKLGRIRIALSPNPLKTAGLFRQTLRLDDATVEVRLGDAVIEVWVDAHHPRILVQIASPVPMTVRARLERWRVKPRVLKGDEVHSAYGLDGGPQPVVVMPDEVVTGLTDRVVWYHRNVSSFWRETLALQGMAAWADRADDPLLYRTFGGALTGEGMENTDAVTLRSIAPVRRCCIALHVLTRQTASLSEWMAGVDRLVVQSREADMEEARRAHADWWRGFWRRSWIRVSGAEEAETVNTGYTLQRFISACAGRGAYPIKFNGSIFTVDAHDLGYSADYRRWGGPYWFQNTRLAYWPMPVSGDFEMMTPLFRMYAEALPMARERTRIYFGHAGAFFPETMYFWGSYASSNYGWDRAGKHPSVVDNNYIKREWTGMLELLALMLDYHAFTQDEDFLGRLLLPMADDLLRFFDEHYARDAYGHLFMHPAQALETYWDVVNPAPDVAGLQWTLDRLLSLPAKQVSAPRRRAWRRLRAAVPPLPIGKENGQEFLLPAARINCKTTNQENPELYAVFPFRLYGLGKPGLDIARATFARRLFPGNEGWRQDDTQAAFLGLADIAGSYVAGRFAAKHEGSRFPAFWGPNFDWVPDQDHGCNGLMALQTMLLQHDGPVIRLFPAWPADWEVAFRLHAPMNTVIEGSFKNGTVGDLDVSPGERRRNISIMPPE